MKTIWLPLILGMLFSQHFAANTRADILNHWTTNQISTNSFGLKHVVYGNGCYVAVGEYGDSGGVYSSANGFNWTLRYSDPNAWGMTLAYSVGHFVGVGGWETIASTNGTNWTASFLPNQYSNNGGGGFPGDMTFGNNIYVEVGDTNGVGTIISSTDGSTWTPRTSAPIPAGHISSIVYGASRFVAIGNNDGFIYRSSVGSANTWTRLSILGGNQISYINGLYMVPLNNNTNLISVDGVNWDPKNTGLTNQLGKTTYVNGLFIGRSGGYLATSSDGTNWLQYPQSIPGSADIASDGSHFVTVASYAGSGFLKNNGFAYTSDILVNVRMTNGPASNVALSGLVGRNYQIQSADTLLGPNIWRTNIILQLTNTPYVWPDSTATNSQRFYRGVLLP